MKGGAKLASSRPRTRRGTSVEIFFYELFMSLDKGRDNVYSTKTLTYKNEREPLVLRTDLMRSIGK